MDRIKCPICNNEHYEDDYEECIKCNWDKYNKWDDVSYSDAVSSAEWKGFGWKCPVCGNYNAGSYPSYDVCPLCEWQHDRVQHDDPDYWGGANKESLNEAKAAWEQLQKHLYKMAEALQHDEMSGM